MAADGTDPSAKTIIPTDRSQVILVIQRSNALDPQIVDV